MSHDLAVVVVNYGSSHLLETNLRGLGDLATVVVVDNFSSATERARLTALAALEGWLTVLPPGNEGFGAGMNLGVEKAQGAGSRHFMLLNPDARLEPDALAELHRLSTLRPDTLLAPRIVRPDGSLWSAGSDLYLDDGRVRSRRRRPDTAVRIEEWLSGACLMISDDLWRRIGGFDDDYFLYWEDIDLSHRVLSAGGHLMLVDALTAVHAEGGTQGGEGASGAAAAGLARSGEPKSKVYYRYNIENRLRYGAKHLSDDDLDAWRKLTYRIAWEVLLQGGRRQFVSSPGTLLVGWKAARAGRRLAADELRRRRAEHSPRA